MLTHTAATNDENSVELFRHVGAGGAGKPQTFSDQLTLSQPGSKLCPPYYYRPPDFQTILRPWNRFHKKVHTRTYEQVLSMNFMLTSHCQAIICD